MPKNKEDNNIYAGIYGGDRSSMPGPTGEQFENLTNALRASSAGLGSGGGGGSMLGLQAARKSLGDISSVYRGFGKDIKGYSSYLGKAVQRGTMSPELAEQSYLNAAMFSGAKKPFEGAQKLGEMEQGFVPKEKYDRYDPFLQLNAQQLLGRNLGSDELGAYKEAFRGMGIYKPADVSAAFGNMLMTTPEARNREVVVDRDLFKDKSKTADELLAMKNAFLNS
jgi:hypothetical protein